MENELELDEHARFLYQEEAVKEVSIGKHIANVRALFDVDLMGDSLERHGFTAASATDILLRIATNDGAKDSDRIRAVESVMKMGRSLAELNGMVQEISVTGMDEEGREGRVKGKRFTSLWSEDDVLTQEDRYAAQRLAGDEGARCRRLVQGDRELRGREVEVEGRVVYDSAAAEPRVDSGGDGEGDAESLG